MKKSIILSLILLMLSACTSSTIKLEDSKNLFTVNDLTYTEEDLLEEILKLDYGQILIQNIEEKVVNDILDADEFEIDEDFKQEYSQFESYAKSMNMSMEQLISAYGFNDIESFENQIKRSIVMDHYTMDKLDQNLAAQIKKYDLFGINLYQVESEETATQMVRYVQSDYEMDQFEKEFDLEESQEAVYHNQIDDMPEDLKEKMDSLSDTKAFFETIGEDVYTVYVYAKKPSDDLAKEVILRETNYAQSLMIDLIKSNNLKIHHSDLKKNMKIDFAEYIK